jgi:hypothetical protein
MPDTASGHVTEAATLPAAGLRTVVSDWSSD